MIVLCDLDGTVSDHRHRLNYVLVKPGGKKDWDTYFRPELMLSDPPIAAAVPIIQKLAFSSRVQFGFLTGRPERTRDVTRLWLKNHTHIDTAPSNHSLRTQGIPLIMRSEGDRRSTSEYKESKIKFFLQNGRLEGGLMFIDDDVRNEAMYAKYGLWLKAPECWEVMR